MTETPTDAPAPKSFATETVELAKTVVIALLIALVLRVVLFQPNTIPSASMEPGLLTGDYMLVSKWDYGWSRHSIPLSPPLPAGKLFARAPERGDVVVFKLPRDERQLYVKRIIGLPGDTIQVRGGAVSVNGQTIPRAYDGPAQDPDSGLDVTRYRETLADGTSYITFDRGEGQEGDDTEVYRVPEGHYFAMGDNRDNSLDSRWPPMAMGVGFVPADNIVGRPRMVLVSWRGGVSLLQPWTWITKFDVGRMFKPVR